MQSNREKLLQSLKATAASRFIAAARLESRDRRLTRVTAITSAYVILLTVFPYFIKLPAAVGDVFNLITVALSIVILVSSLLQYSSGDIVNAEQHHRSALEINEQRRLLMLTPNDTADEKLELFVKSYNAVLQKYSVNHSNDDFQKFQMERPEEFPWITRSQRIIIRARLWVFGHFATLVLVAITTLMCWLIFFYAYPVRISAHPG